MVSSLNDNEIDFRISFDEFDDEEYPVIFDKNSFSYKIIFANDLKTDSENNNEKVNMPLFPSPEPSVSCIDDLDFFKDFENEFSAIVYNDALTSKSDFSTEPTLFPQYFDEFDLKDETLLSEYNEEEQNVLYFNDVFPFNIIYPDDLNSDKGNDDNKIDIIQSLGGNVNTQGSNELLEGSHDKINKVFIMKSFVMELNVNIMAWNYLVNEMLFNLIKNLYVPFGIPFDPKRYYKDGVYTRMLRRPRSLYGVSISKFVVSSPRTKDFETRLAKIYRREVHRVQVFDFGGLSDLMAKGLSSRMLMEHRDAQGQSLFTSRAWSRLFDIRGPLVHELILEFFSTYRFGEVVLDLDTAGALQFQLGRVRRHMSWREFILALGLHTTEEMQTASFGLYWAESERQIPDKGHLSAYWIGISFVGDFLGMDIGSVNVPYLLARYLRLLASGIKQGGMISGDILVIDMYELVRLQICMELDDTWAWVAPGPKRQPDAAAAPVQAPQPRPPVAEPARTMAQRLAKVEEDVHEIRGALGEQREILDSIARDFSRFSTWTVVGLSQMMSQARVRYTSYANFQIPYARHTKYRTDGASTFTAQQDEQQPDP
ncbi:hypothetical protein Tco_1393719 [Tanacetum coccineum]